eukprot:SAG22_NODE_105_length_20045_cov_23.373308_4_plen_189_part_00
MSRHKGGAPSILDRPSLDANARQQVSLSAFSFLFSEMVQYCRDRAEQLPDLERKLEELGYRVGSRSLELCTFRDKPGRRETKVLGMLTFIKDSVWTNLFGKPADDIQKSVENEGEYFLIDNLPLVNQFISVPDDHGQFNCGAFLAGIVAGCLEGAEFPAVVKAISQDTRTFILIRFSAEVLEREKRLP